MAGPSPLTSPGHLTSQPRLLGHRAETPKPLAGRPYILLPPPWCDSRLCLKECISLKSQCQVHTPSPHLRRRRSRHKCWKFPERGCRCHSRRGGLGSGPSAPTAGKEVGMGRQRPLLAIRQKTEDYGEANPEPLGFPALQMGACQQGQRQPFLTPSAAVSTRWRHQVGFSYKCE